MLTRARLQQLADDLLADLAGNTLLFGQFMAETGLDPGELRGLAATPGDDLAVALLDFICREDDRLLDFSSRSGWPAQQIAYARAALEAGAFR